MDCNIFQMSFSAITNIIMNRTRLNHCNNNLKIIIQHKIKLIHKVEWKNKKI